MSEFLLKLEASGLDYWQSTTAAKALCISVSSDACDCLGNFNFSDRSGRLCCSYCLKIKSELVLAFKAREERERKKKGETSSALRLNRQHPARPHLYLISTEISAEAQQRCIKCNCFHAKTNISRAPCVTDGLCCSLKQTSNLHSNLLLSSAGAAFKQTFEAFFFDKRQRNVFTCTWGCKMIYEHPLMCGPGF